MQKTKEDGTIKKDNEKIDFSKPIQLIIAHAPDMNTVYDIDLSKYK